MGEEYTLEKGILELHELIPNSRKNIFGVRTNEFLEEILNGETHEILKDNYDRYNSRIKKMEKIPFLSLPIKILKNIYGPPQTVFLFDNENVPEDYREELKEFKKDVPYSYPLTKKGNQYFYGFEPGGIETDFAILEYIPDKNYILIKNETTGNVLVVKNNIVLRDKLVHNTVAEPYNI